MTKNKIPEVLILGLPNAGKSTLVNALSKRKTSIIGSTPNTTRDKVTTTLKFEDEKKLLISDLPGFLEDPDEINHKFQDNILRYINKAEHILFLIDVQSKNYSGLDSIFKLINNNNMQNKTTTVFNKAENFEIENLDPRCSFKKYNLKCEFGNWPAKYRENFQVIFETNDGSKIDKKKLKSIKPKLDGKSDNILLNTNFTLKNFKKV